ncbi:MAG: toll/interleukin-1 receptor domain-containing protein [Promethearchaeota archaeon]
MGKKIFFSYADSDSEYFQLPTIVNALELLKEIDKVLYWKRDAKTDISNFMFEEIVKCDDFVVFCTEKSLQSQAVRQECEFVFRLGKRIIPIFEDVSNIPENLKTKHGIDVSQSPDKKKRRKKGPDIAKLIHDLQILILDRNTGAIPNFDEYKKILAKSKMTILYGNFYPIFIQRSRYRAQNDMSPTY